jgi:hypothetical protein
MNIPTLSEFTFVDDPLLDNKDNNALLAKGLIKNLNKHFIKSLSVSTGKIDIFETSKCFITLLVRETKWPEILYKVDFDSQYYECFDRECIQNIRIWTNRKNSYTYGVGKEVFFSGLLDAYHTVIADMWNDNNGSNSYWGYRMVDALETENCHVYYIDFSDKNEIIKLDNRYDFSKLLNDKRKNVEKHQARRFVITTKPF